MMRLAALALLVPLASCDLPPPDPETAALRCEQRARAAQGPTGTVAVGINNRDGLRSGASIGVTSDFLAGRDPLAVYQDCVVRATGENPIRPPRLRQ